MNETLIQKLARYRKAVIGIVAAVSLAVSQGLISGQAAKWSSVAIGALAALGVYVVPNEPPAAPPVADPNV